jgi:2-hydroxy-6-oxonona-2,4-dienedioate hydrolase
MTIWTDLQGKGIREVYYQAGGFRTRVIECGQPSKTNRPLFLIHGTGGNAEGFAHNIGYFAQDGLVLAPDLVGHGYSDRPDIEYNLDVFADHVLALANRIGMERIDIAGGSMGGLTGCWFAIKYPERIGRLVLNATLLTQADEEGMPGVKQAIALADQLEAGITMDSVRARMHWLVEKPEDMPDEQIESRYRVYLQPGMPEIMNKIMRMLLTWLAGDESGERYMGSGVMNKIACPVLEIYTPVNPVWSQTQARRLNEEMPNLRLTFLPGGHWPQLEHRDKWNSLVREFLAER